MAVTVSMLARISMNLLLFYSTLNRTELFSTEKKKRTTTWENIHGGLKAVLFHFIVAHTSLIARKNALLPFPLVRKLKKPLFYRFSRVTNSVLSLSFLIRNRRNTVRHWIISHLWGVRYQFSGLSLHSSFTLFSGGL